MGSQQEPGKQRTGIRVRYAETDQMGVVYYANYYVWMEIGRTEFVRSRGIQYRDIECEEGLVLAVVECSCRYRRPARYDQDIHIDTWITAANHRVISFAYEIREAVSDTLLATGASTHMWLNREWRPANLPARYVEQLRGDHGIVKKLENDVNPASS